MYVNPSYVDLLYNIVSKYKTRLTLDNFDVSLYNLFSLATTYDNAYNTLQNIDKTVVYDNLFQELQTRSVTSDVFEDWLELLNKLGILTTQEYAKFSNSYTVLNQLSAQYTQLLSQENELHNMRYQIEQLVYPLQSQLDGYHDEIESLIESRTSSQQRLAELQAYEPYDFYVGELLDNGLYVGANPVSTFFGGYGPGAVQYRLILTKTIPSNEGRYSIMAKQNGISEDGYPLYIELARMEELEIVALEEILDNIAAELEYAAIKYDETHAAIEATLINNGYEQNQELLDALYNQMDNLEAKIIEQRDEIEEIFGVPEIELTFI